MHMYHEATATELHDVLCTSLARTSRDSVDDDISISVSRHNVLAAAHRFEWDLDLSSLWLSKQRWTMLINQYVDVGAMDYWLDSIETGLAVKKSARGVATMRTNTVAPRKTGKGLTRRWGSCILGFSYRQLPQPQFTMHSRTSYLGYIAALDISLAHCLASAVGERTGIPPEEMMFVWQLEAAQFHPMRSMAWYFDGSLDQRDFLRFRVDHPQARQICPGMYHSRKWFDKFQKMDEEGLLYEDMTYSTYARMRKRWHTEIKGYDYGEPFETPNAKRFKPLPSLKTGDLVLKFSKSALRREADLDKVEENYDGVPD
jgi:hypothetical protein